MLSATRTPPAPSLIQVRSGQHWFQMGKHTPQRTARAVLKAAHFHYRVAHSQGASSWRDPDLSSEPARCGGAGTSRYPSTIAHCAGSYRRCTSVALGGVPQNKTLVEKAAGLGCLLLRGEVHIHAPLKQINIHFIMIFLCALP